MDAYATRRPNESRGSNVASRGTATTGGRPKQRRTLGLKAVDLGLADNLRENSEPAPQSRLKKKMAVLKRELVYKEKTPNYLDYNFNIPLRMQTLSKEFKMSQPTIIGGLKVSTSRMTGTAK